MIDPVLRALLDSCHADPEDDAPRLVLADWLDERDDPFERGRLIRLSVGQGGFEESDSEHLRSVADWRGRHLERWLGPNVPGLAVLGERGLLGLMARRAIDFAELPPGLQRAVEQGWVAVLRLDVRDGHGVSRMLRGWPSDLPGLATSVANPETTLLQALPAGLRNLAVSDRGGLDGLQDSFAWLARLSRLRQLDVSSDTLVLTPTHIEHLARQPRLETFHVYLGNQIEEGARFASMSLARLTRLRSLTLAGDWLDEPIEVVWPANLEQLTVRVSRGVGPAGDFGSLGSLRHLHLTGVRTFANGSAWLARLTGLRTLEVTRCPAWEDCLPFLGGSRDLETLDLHAGRLHTATTDGIADLATLPHLHTLYLESSEGLKADALVPLRMAAALRHLDLSYSDWVDDETLRTLAGLSQLHSLSLAGSMINISDEELQRLRESLPNTRIYRT